jgi:predicted DNA binding CopG/RHH family protein
MVKEKFMSIKYLDPNDAKTTAIKIRVSEKEKRKIKENAKKRGLKMSEYLREVGLENKLEIKETPHETSNQTD